MLFWRAVEDYRLLLVQLVDQQLLVSEQVTNSVTAAIAVFVQFLHKYATFSLNVTEEMLQQVECDLSSCTNISFIGRKRVASEAKPAASSVDVNFSNNDLSGDNGASVPMSQEQRLAKLRTLFDALQDEIYRVMKSDSWTRYVRISPIVLRSDAKQINDLRF